MDKRLLARIRKMADSGNWHVREDAAVLIKEINDRHFTEYFSEWKKWAKDRNPNIRRALEVGMLRVPKEHAQDALALIEPLLSDRNVYVRKNCGQFALAAVCYRDKELAFRKLRKWSKSKDDQVRWNVAMAFGTYFGNKHPKESLQILRTLAKDRNKYVWRAAASSTIKILRKHPEFKKDVYSWKKREDFLFIIRKYAK